MAANGQLSASQLVGVEGQLLSPLTAAAYRELKAAAAHQKHAISIWRPAGGYRSWAVQQDMRNPARASFYNIRPGVTLAEAGQSRHGQGRAVDIQASTVAGRNWVQTNAHKFGFSRPMVKTDPDHYELGRNVVTVTDPTPAPTPTPTPTPQEQIPMTSAVFYRGKVSGKIYARQDPFAEPNSRESWMQFVDEVTWNVLEGNHNAYASIDETYLIQSIAEFGLIGAGRFRRNETTGQIWGQLVPGAQFVLLTPAQWSVAQSAGGIYKQVPAAQFPAAVTVPQVAVPVPGGQGDVLTAISNAQDLLLKRIDAQPTRFTVTPS